MRKKIVVSVLCCLAVISAALFLAFHTPVGKMVSVRTPDGAAGADAVRAPFELQEIITGCGGKVNACVFRGKIEEIKTCERAWKDAAGEKWGPFACAVLKVSLSDVLSGALPDDLQTVRVVYPYPLYPAEKNSVALLEGQEYVFANCWLIDDLYYAYAQSQDPSCSWRNDPALKAGEVLSGAAWCSILPVENENVYLYRGYAEQTPDVLAKAIPAEGLKTSLLTSDNAFSTGNYIALSYGDFRGLLQTLAAFYGSY